jgi:AcrR family transcriptional regulator
MGAGSSHERVNQKRRTRAALVSAAAELLRQGLSPSVAQVADAAQVSRATAYRYFPSPEMLLAEALLQPSVDPTIERALAAAAGQDVATHLDTLVHALQTATVAQEDAFRALLRLSLAPPLQGQRPALPASPRGGRRVRWIEEILAPVVPDDGVRARRLVAALALCMGIEALVVLRDVCGLTAAEAEQASRWAAQALLQAGLAPLEARDDSSPHDPTDRTGGGPHTAGTGAGPSPVRAAGEDAERPE